MRYLKKILASILCVIIVMSSIDLSGISGLIVKASTDGTSSTDYLDIQWSTGGSSQAVNKGIKEGNYSANNVDANNTVSGKLELDNTSVDGNMHMNIDETINLYAPVADKEYTEIIGYSGDYVYTAAGGKGGNLSKCYDPWSGKTISSTGGKGSSIRSAEYFYETKTSIKYRVGSNGRNVSGTVSRNDPQYTPPLNVQSAGNDGWTIMAQAGSASYIQVKDEYYLVAGAGAPGAGQYTQYGSTYGTFNPVIANADSRPPCEKGRALANPSSSDMTYRWSDTPRGNLNYNRLLGCVVLEGIEDIYGKTHYEDVAMGFTKEKGNVLTADGVSPVYAGYSGYGERNGGKFDRATTPGVSVTRLGESDKPFAQLTCNAKYATITNPTRPGYTFNGWTTKNGVTATKNNNGTYTMKITKSGSTITANWEENKYTLTFDANKPANATSNVVNSTPSKTVTYDKEIGTIPTASLNGWKFQGWYTATTGGTKINSTDIWKTAANTTVYAHWEPITYNIKYNPNNPNTNAQVTGSMTNSSFKYDTAGKLTANAFARNAYTFTGWNTVPDGTGTARENGAYILNWSSTNNAIINLYAQWRLNTKNITGTVSWSDQDNKYASRPGNVQVTLHHDNDTVAILKEPDVNPLTVTGNSNYTFTNTQTQKETNNQNYNYTVTQNVVPGYKTTINGFNITNELIVPTYTSNITCTAVDTYKNEYLKNGKVKINAVVTNTNDNTYPELGLNNGIVKLTVDSGITLDTSTLKIYHTNAAGTKKQVTAYTVSGNVITIDFGDSKISKAKDKLDIEIIGTANAIKEYTSSVALTGNLRDIRGTNTSIKLGTLTSTSKKFTVTYQMPQANIKITKTDSITEAKLTDAIFTLYEWNGSSYAEKEVITDTNKDGIYESKYYEWNVTTNGKYKIVETGIPANHKELKFSMEFTIDQLKTANYTITPDYNNKEYTIKYNVRNPDDLDKTNGIVENEPYKIKARVDLLDEETMNQIVNPATFKIYEWDKAKNSYKLYTSYTNGKEVPMTRLADKTYLTGEWLYYTPNNEGKYRIVEETAPTGYYGDYNEAKAKRTYDLNVLALVGANGASNEMTITLSNNKGHFTNKRTKAEIKVNKVDSQTKGKAQVDATLKGAVYEVYAKNDIHHADGITTNYQGQTALLYKANELVTTKTTDAEGKITFDNLECGTYYIKEKTPSKGYLLDTVAHDVILEYRGQDIEIVKEERTYEEKVIKQGFQIYKIKQTDRTEYEGLQNSGFTIYQISNLSIVKNGKITKNVDGTYMLNDPEAKKDSSITKLANKNGTYNIIDLIDYYYKIKYTEDDMTKLPQNNSSYFPYNINEPKVKDYSSNQNGVEIKELISTGDGYIRSPELAYGEYIVLETTVPKNLATAKPFFINVQQDSRDPQKLKFIVDGNFETKVKVYKKDANTGKTILQNNVKYVIYNELGDLMTTKTWDATNGYVEYGTLEHPFITGTSGYLITPMVLPVGKYTLRELEAPNGYILNGHEGYTENGKLVNKPLAVVKFEVSTAGIYYADDYLDTSVIVVNQQNEEQVGTLKLTTTGEYIKDANKKTDGNYEFTYETRPVQGATYEIRAKENIVAKDGHNTLIYTKDQVVRKATSNQDGIIYIDNLPLGKYYIKQTVAGNGFVLNKEQKEFEIAYGSNNKNLQVGSKEWKESAQTTPVLNIEESYKNQRQQLQITVNKTDIETNEKIRRNNNWAICEGKYNKHSYKSNNNSKRPINTTRNNK